MSGVTRMRRLQRTGQTLVPFALAAVVVLVGALVYLELVSVLIAHLG